MKTAYFEMIGGASGNMLLGALIDAGAERAAIEAALRTIPLGDWEMIHERVIKRGIAATHVDFNISGADAQGHEHEAHRHLADVIAIVERSGLSDAQKHRANAIYTRLADAEAKVHGATRDAIHFHEVGQVDAILDVSAFCVGLDLLGVETVTCSAYPLGRGSITMQHGVYPNPPPATAELMRGAPTFDAGIDGEMVTTTGAAILSSLVQRVGVRPALRVDAIGYGAGRSDFPIPNVVRVMIGTDEGAALAHDEVALIETNIDDMNPQFYEAVFERLFAAGALDVWTTAIAMKKSRPAIALCAMAPLGLAEACAQVILEHTTTIGVRVRREGRIVLERSSGVADTPYGQVRYKMVELGEGRRRRTLEYDDLRHLAQVHNRPIAQLALELERLIAENDH